MSILKEIPPELTGIVEAIETLKKRNNGMLEFKVVVQDGVVVKVFKNFESQVIYKRIS